jgi:hypothetical protein
MELEHTMKKMFFLLFNLFKTHKIRHFLGVFCADSEYMLDVANRLTLAKKLIFGKIPKKWEENPTQKFFFLIYQTK